MNTSKVTYPANEVVGFCGSAGAMLTKYKGQMIAAKIDPTDLIAQLDPEAKAITAANDVQEGIKTQLKDATTAVNAAVATAYGDCSNACDMVITAFGRGSSQAQEATNLRKSVRPASPPRHESPHPHPADALNRPAAANSVPEPSKPGLDGSGRSFYVSGRSPEVSRFKPELSGPKPETSGKSPAMSGSRPEASGLLPEPANFSPAAAGMIKYQRVA
jgi:hypothetical protein